MRTKVVCSAIDDKERMALGNAYQQRKTELQVAL